MTTSDLIQEVTQSLLAIMVTAGAGYALLFVPSAPSAPITTALGLVLGWYFTKSTVAQVTAANTAATSAATAAANAANAATSAARATNS